MAGVYVTSSGTKFSISSTPAPATADTLSEIAALTFTEVGGIMTLGTFGDTRNLVNFAVLGDGRTRKLAGAADAGTLNVECAFDALDPGQIAMRAAYDAGDEFAFKVEPQDGQAPNPNSMFYFKGPVTSKAVNVNNNDSVLSQTFVVAVNTTVFDDLSAAA
jgi:hypothetical protein